MPVLALPHRLEPFGLIPGWTVRRFSSAQDAAAFFQRYQCAAMPCWRRMDVVAGALMLVR